MDADTKSFAETANEVENEEQINSGEESPSASEQAPELQEEAKNLASLDKDEEFKKTVPQNFNQNKDWRKMYWKMKESERRAKEFEEQLSQLSNQEQEEQDIDDNKLAEIAKSKGYQLTKAQQEQAKEDMKDELEQLIQAAETPEQQAWVRKFANAIMNKMDSKINPQLQPMGEMMIEYRLEKSEKNARKLIEQINQKHGLKLDYDKDVDPELAKIVKSNKNLTPMNCDMVMLTRMFLADKGIELGKKISEREAIKLNEEKKRVNVETPTTGTSPRSDSDKSLKEIMMEEANSQGLKF